MPRGEAGEDGPAVILLDLNLPQIDVLEVLRQVRAHPQLLVIPVVVLTISAEHANAQAAYRLSANAYIVKPVAFEKFMDVSASIELYWTLVNPQAY